MSNRFRKQIVSSMFWRFGERFLAQIVTFIVSIVLARLLTPTDYGSVALLMIFIEFADVFVIHGFSTSLVQKKNADNVDFSSVFYFSLGFTVLIYIVFFMISPLLNVFFKSNTLTNLFRVLALRIPLSGINSVQHAYVQRNMLFKKFFFATLGGTIGSAFLGFTLAYNGFGAWALVAQYLGNSVCDTIILWCTVRWRPGKAFSWKRLKELLGFGGKMLGSQLIHVLYRRLNSLVIGTMYSASDLAYYEQGEKIPGVVETNIDTTINSVLFPAMSQVQDDLGQLKQIVRKSIRVSALFVWPLMVGLAVMANEVISCVYTDKWLPCVIFMQIACIKLSMEPIQTANLQVVKAIGRSDIYIKMELVKKVYGLLALFITMRFGIVAIAIGSLSQAFFSFIINLIPNHKLICYSFSEQMRDIIPSVIFSLIMGCVVYFVGGNLPDTIFFMFVQIGLGIVIYVLLTYLFRKHDFIFICSLIRSLF